MPKRPKNALGQNQPHLQVWTEDGVHVATFKFYLDAIRYLYITPYARYIQYSGRKNSVIWTKGVDGEGWTPKAKTQYNTHSTLEYAEPNFFHTFALQLAERDKTTP